VFPQPPIHVETVRVGVDLDDLVVFGSRGDDLGHVDGVAFTHEQQPARRMGEHRDLRMRQRLADAFGHLVRVHIESLMDGGHNIVEQRQRLVVKIERAIAKNVALGAEENAEAFPGATWR